MDLDFEHSSYRTKLLFESTIILVLLLCCFIRIELRDEWRLKNRKAFANIWSDMVYGIALFILIYFNKSKVSFVSNILLIFSLFAFREFVSFTTSINFIHCF